MGQFQCNHKPAEHDQATGTNRGRAVTSWREDYEQQQMAAELVRAMQPSQYMGLGVVLTDSEVEPPRFDKHIFANHVQQCFAGIDNIIHAAFPGAESSTGDVAPNVEDSNSTSSNSPPTVFKVTDPDMAKQLGVLQFPGRYRRPDLPTPVQVQLRKWTGIEVDACYLQAFKVLCTNTQRCLSNMPTHSGSRWWRVVHHLHGTVD